MVEKGTAFASSGLPFSYVGDYAISFGVNTLYGISEGEENMPVWWFSAGRQWGIDALLKMDADSEINYDLRNLTFNSTAGKTVGLIYNPSRGCLRVMDDIYDLAPPMEDYQMHELNVRLADFSNPAQILNTEDLAFNEAVFGKEQKLTWCYFYEKADLARQFEDWQEAANLYKQSQALSLKPTHGAEYAPFIISAVNLGNWDQADKLTRMANDITNDMQPMLCNLWQTLPQQDPPDAEQVTTTAEITTYLSCE